MIFDDFTCVRCYVAAKNYGVMASTTRYWRQMINTNLFYFIVNYHDIPITMCLGCISTPQWMVRRCTGCHIWFDAFSYR